MYDPDEPLTFTPNGIPTSLRPYLQEYTLERLTPATGEHVLIERTLEYGGRRELRWLFKQYGRERLAAWVSQFGFMNLSPIPFNFWRIVLEVESYRKRDVSQSPWHNRLKRSAYHPRWEGVALPVGDGGAVGQLERSSGPDRKSGDADGSEANSNKMNIHWEAVSPAMRMLLYDLSEFPFTARFYLAGGTALALQYGHRRSVDLDFFSETDVVRRATHEEIRAALLEWPDCELEEEPHGGAIDFNISGTRVGFYSYGYPLLAPQEQVYGLKLAAPLDIGLMKLDALGTRAARKDFVDLYFIARQIPLDELLRQAPNKYRYARDFAVMSIQNLTYFDNADRYRDVDMIEPIEWRQVRRFFVTEARQLAREWL